MSLHETLQKVKESALGMALIQTEDKNEALSFFAHLLEDETEFLLTENAKDLAEQKGQISDSLYQRLKLDASKISTLAKGCRDLMKAKDPVGQTLLLRELDSNLILERVSVPLGVIGVVFESRPDVIPQILSLLLKSGNAAVLKGGREANHSNRAFMTLVERLNKHFTFFPSHWAVLIDTREEVREMLKHDDLIDLVIPRGSNSLVKSIKDSTRIPVLGHAEGICHVYVHENADLKKALRLVIDSKAQYASACNAAETLLVDKKIATKFLKDFGLEAAKSGIQLIGCEETRQILKDAKPATEDDWHTEYGDLRLSVRVVTGIEQAMEHINHYGSHHTDTIVTESQFVSEIFLNGIDSACVFVNASTRFADGFRFGFGAEVGISTDKLHARGPVGIEGLVTYKYKLRGTGQIVADYSGPMAKTYSHRDLGGSKS